MTDQLAKCAGKNSCKIEFGFNGKTGGGIVPSKTFEGYTSEQNN